MKRLGIKSHISNLSFGYISEDHIKQMLSRQLAQEIAENFFKDLQLKRDENDKLHTIEYYYNFFVLETREYGAIMDKLQRVIDCLQSSEILEQHEHSLSLLHSIVNDLTSNTN